MGHQTRFLQNGEVSLNLTQLQLEGQYVDDDKCQWDGPRCEFGQGRDDVPARTLFGWRFDEKRRLLAFRGHCDDGLRIKVGSQTPMSESLNGTTHSFPAG
jgi:hypothetical protein